MKRTSIIGLATLAFTITIGEACEPIIPKEKSRNLTETFIPIAKKNDNTVQIALLLDTSNSMDGLINQAKSQLWDIVNEFSHAKCATNERPILKIALYQYGNDALSASEGYIQQVLNFSSDLDEISEKLFSLSTNGGEEYCGKVIQTTLSQLNWDKNPDHLKMIFIAGNEPFDQGRFNYKAAITNAKEKGVVVNTIFCGAYEQGINSHWQNGAITSGGEYMAIDHNKEVVYVKTPYDEIIIKLNKQLNTTYISYGTLGISKKTAQISQDSNAMELEEAVVVKRAVSKSSSFYNNKSWDLVDAAEEDDFKLTSIDKKDLPEDLRGKSEKEIALFIESKKQERVKIQEEIRDANTKREAYIAKNKPTDEKGGLESAMITAIKKQAASKNYTWD